MRSYRPTSSSVKANTKEKLVFVREGVLYGLVIEDAKTEKTSINRGIVSTPNIVFYSNNTKCLIDYSNQTNKGIESQIDEYFKQIQNGTSFNILNGIYNDTNSNKMADLSGEYIFRSYYNGIVEADVTSVTLLSSTINRYDKTRFEQIPYLVPTTIKTETEIRSVLKNKLGKNTKNSFNYLGIKVGDYIKITDITSQLKVMELNIDSDGNEYILLDRQISSIDLTNIKTKVDVYILVTDSFTNNPDPIDNNIGSCIEYFNGVVVSCTDNHTASQCRFRSSASRGIVSEFNFNTFCRTPETDTAIQKSTTDNLIQLSTTIASALSNMNSSNSVGGAINNKGNIKNTFYGRPF